MRVYFPGSIHGLARVDSPAHPPAVWHCACTSGLPLEWCRRSRLVQKDRNGGFPPDGMIRELSHQGVKDLLCRSHSFPETRKIDRFERGCTIRIRQRENSRSRRSVVSAKRSTIKAGGHGTRPREESRPLVPCL